MKHGYANGMRGWGAAKLGSSRKPKLPHSGRTKSSGKLPDITAPSKSQQASPVYGKGGMHGPRGSSKSFYP